MIRRRIRLACAALLALSLAAPLAAQNGPCPTNYAQITGAKIGALSTLALGKLTVIAQGTDGNPINFSVPGVGVELLNPKFDNIVAGNLVNTLCLARSDRSSIPITYRFIVRDTSATGQNKVVLDVSGVPITVDVFSLDSYSYAQNNAGYINNTVYNGIAAYPQTPSGTIDGNNTTFTVNGSPTAGLLYRNGLQQQPAIDYNLNTSNSTITFTAPPQPGDVLIWVTINLNSGANGQPGSASFASLSGSPYDNAALNTALSNIEAGKASFAQLAGAPTDNSMLASALAAKASATATWTLNGQLMQLGGTYTIATGNGNGSSTFAGLTDAPTANSQLAADLNAKQNNLGFTPENIVNKGAANGYAPLDSTGKVPSANLPTTSGTGLAANNSSVTTALGYQPPPVSSLSTLALEGANASNIATDAEVPFSDGTNFFKAAPQYVDSWISDTTITMENIPEFFTAADVKNYIVKFIAQKSNTSAYPNLPAGSIPIVLTNTGALGTNIVANAYCAGFDTYCHHATAEGIFSLVHAENLYYQKSHDLSEFTSDQTTIDTALSAVPMDGTTDIPSITAGDEWVVFGFQESIRFTGLNAVGAMQLWKTATEAAALYGLVGNTSLQNKYANIASTIASNLGTSSALWDSADGMFYGATGQNKQIDTIASTLFCHYAIPSPNAAAQCNAISSYMVSNYATLFFQGYLRQSNTQFATVGGLSTGGAPYSTSDPRDGTGCYQGGGFWSVVDGAAAETLAITSPTQAAQLFADFQSTPDPTMEYKAPSCGTSGYTQGFTNNLESAATIENAARKMPGLAKRANLGLGSLSTSGGPWSSTALDGVPNLIGGGTGEVGAVQNTNPAGYSSYNFFDSAGNARALVGYGNTSVPQASLQGSAFFGAIGKPMCLFVSLGTCALSINSSGQTTIANLAGSASNSYGTPTITAANGSAATLAGPSTSQTPGWVGNDHLFTVAATPSANIAAGTNIFTVLFGKQWYDANNNGTLANCHADSMLQYAPLYRPLAADNSKTTAFSTATALTGNGSTTYAWSIECGADHEQ